MGGSLDQQLLKFIFPLAVLPLCFQAVTKGYSGELRLLGVKQMIQGVRGDDKMFISFLCRSKREKLEPAPQNRCTSNARPNQSTLKPVPRRYTPELCMGGWSHFNGICYKYLAHQTTWDDGREGCRSLGGDLARIPNEEHNDYLMRMIRSPAWILLNDKRIEGNFEYSPNETAIYVNWKRGEPNDALGIRSEDCVEIYPSTGERDDGEWNDHACTTLRSNICFRQSEVYLPNRINCTGNENRLDECQRGNLDSHSCGQGQVVMVTCAFSHDQVGLGEVPAMNTDMVYRGVLQVRHNGKWRYICDSGFGLEESQVACRQLGNLHHVTYELVPRDTGPAELTMYRVGCSEGLNNGQTCNKTDEGYLCQDGNTNMSVTCVAQSKMCANGRYGESCVRKCGRCVGGRCSVTDGVCLGTGCEPGYIGPKCDQACPGGWWGVNCTRACGRCSNGLCDVTSGVCCRTGQQGSDCHGVVCPSDRWGFNCNQTCGACRFGTCDVISGECPKGACKIGYTGTKCDMRCLAGTWGLNCNKTCGNCLGYVCSVADGRCISGVCQAGFEGKTCENKETCDKMCPPCDECVEIDQGSGQCHGQWLFPTVVTTITLAGVLTLVFAAQCTGLILWKKKKSSDTE